MQLRGVPVIALLIWLIAGAALLPAVMAAVQGDERTARGFFWTTIGGLGLGAMLALALKRPDHRVTPREELVAYLLAWVVLPLIAALPLMAIGIAPGVAIFEMVADFTTTGGTALPDLAAMPGAVHLWRGMMGWLGGFLILVAAHAVLAPRNLGGVEVRGAGISVASIASIGAMAATPEQRVGRAVRVILPVYTGLTGVAIMALSLAGQQALDATVHGMSLLSTSGISPYAGGIGAGSTRLVEAVAIAFMLLGAIRLTFDPSRQGGVARNWGLDPEIRLLLAFVVLATLVLFLRHFASAIGDPALGDVGDGWKAVWGAFFTAVSFATTTGFFSSDWASVRWWSGLEHPGLVLLALAALGGGAATTAGGVKLIRIHALGKQCARELTRLSQPNAMPRVGPDPSGHDAILPGPAATEARTARREGALIAWAFIMLFLAATIFATLALTLTGFAFDRALVAALACISNTGPAYGAVFEGSSFATTPPLAQGILMVVMVVGRIETLALIALFNPDRWR